jgi:hypothetical protein
VDGLRLHNPRLSVARTTPIGVENLGHVKTLKGVFEIERFKDIAVGRSNS